MKDLLATSSTHCTLAPASRSVRRAMAVVLLAALALGACGGGGDDDPNNGWVCVGGCPSEGVTAVNNADRAERLVSAIAEVALGAIPSGTYSNRSVNGDSGSATFSGHSTSSRTSCGSNCTQLAHDTDVDAVFNGFRVALGSNQWVTLNGTMTISDTTSNRTTPTTSTSSGSVLVQTSRLQARHEITESTGQVWGEADTVAVSARSSSGSSWSGTLQASNGANYSF